MKTRIMHVECEEDQRPRVLYLSLYLTIFRNMYLPPSRDFHKNRTIQSRFWSRKNRKGPGKFLR